MERARVTPSTNRVLPAFLLAAAAAISGCAADTQPETATAEGDIIGGVPARSAKLNAIGAIGYNYFGSWFPICTGTLINPHMVVTAEHCVNFVGDPSTELAFLVGYDVNNISTTNPDPTKVIPVKGVAWEDTVQGGVVGLGVDVAVMHLAADVPGVTPLDYAELTSDKVGLRFTAVGYGWQDMAHTAGTRKAGSLTLQQMGGRVFQAIYGSFDKFLADAAHWGFDPKDPNTAAQMQQLWDSYLLLDGVESWFGNGKTDAQDCHGDSGGPITLSINGKTTVFGTTSWGFDAANGLCELGGAFSTFGPVAMDFLAYQSACPMVPRAGTCLDLNTAERCIPPTEGGYKITTTDCSQLGQICGVDEAGELGCIDDPCEGIPAEGVCEGAVAKRCTKPEEGPRRVVTTDCGALGGSCGIENGEVACVDVPAQCDHQVCDQGTKLDSTCGACVSNICTVDPYCCNVQWDGICVNEVQTVCNETCPGAPFINKHAVPTARLFH